MNLKTLCLSLAMSLILVQNALAEATPAVQQMAQILLELDNAPTKEQQEQLENLLDSGALTANEQNLARALQSFNGTLTAEGKQLVWGSLRSISGADDERELAKIINGINGKANEGERQRLEKLLPPKPNAEEKKKNKKK